MVVYERVEESGPSLALRTGVNIVIDSLHSHGWLEW